MSGGSCRVRAVSARRSSFRAGGGGAAAAAASRAVASCSPLTDLTATASLRALHEAIARGPGDRLVLPATRAARDRAWAIQRGQLRRVQAAS